MSPARSASGRFGAAAAAGAIALAAVTAGAQRYDAVAASAVHAPEEMEAAALREAMRRLDPSRPAAPSNGDGRPWVPPLASLVVPGAGQARLGQDRFVPYLALEAYAWLRYRVDRRDARRFRSEYRELARRVARSAFGPVTPPGPFEYYERMQKWVESGAYDVMPGGAIDPETDTTTFNGAQWLLARRTFWSDPDQPPPVGSPEYDAALAFYTGRAVTPLYRWSWRDAQLEQDLFRRTIGRSNDAFRNAGTDLGIILANHVLSMVDAFVTVRIRQLRDRERGVGMVIQAPLPGALPE